MKNIIRIIIVAVASSLFFCSCSKEFFSRLKDSDTDVSGEWKLVSVGGVPAEDLSLDGISGHDVYVAFSEGRFETFERIPSTRKYVRYAGSYAVRGNVLSGTYDDGSAMGADYKVIVEKSALTMDPGGRQNVYESVEIPEAVRDNAYDGISFKSSGSSIPCKML